MKILIWNDFPLKARQGGPSTYLFNLKKSVESNKIQNITFLNNKDPRIKKVRTTKFTYFYKNVFRKNIFKFFFGNNFEANRKIKKTIKFHTTPIELPEGIRLNEYSHIHFHTTYSYYKAKEILKDFKGKVLLTSHSPKATHIEIIEDLLYGFSLKEDEREVLRKIDEFAFSNTDYVIFPCIEAQEPYFNSWSDYKNIQRKNKVVEFLTCCSEANIKRTKEDVFREYNIPKGSFVITYFGRHNEVKGFDVLKRFGKEVLKKYPNIYFLIAGTEEPLRGLKHERWIEVGWTNDPHSIVSAADLYILPNKETYFDLALLEVLSIGTTSLLSTTGGNKYFKRLPESETGGLFYYNNTLDDMLKTFEFIYENKSEINNQNKEIFKKYFDNKNFAVNYLSMIETLK
ncbi:glycosyltransferase family 4 protein [Tenacibaculum sp. Mcav3-52]|uniref:glycosyltransferase family 4 protein n=1 Tax=Tenacibaculum sp. Mcav3-52 TaxID=2917762 RepID=UPI001EF1BA72|nr:glycosyltransferase family 4 protein [Tenacibaculum sp. Mcav3-52]MCG7502463.1 glycosyltransferase family 4 protein [Tenacibaculum sp. Mcav3-52]